MNDLLARLHPWATLHTMVLSLALFGLNALLLHRAPGEPKLDHVPTLCPSIRTTTRLRRPA